MPKNLKYQILVGYLQGQPGRRICGNDTMKKVLFTSLLLAVLIQAPAQTSSSGRGVSVEGTVRFDKTVHDFGEILVSDGPQTCSFEVENISGEATAILNVVSSCGCTDVKWTREPLQPGKKGKITATYSNDQGAYPFDKTLTVYVAGLKKPVILRLRGSVHEKKKPLAEIYTERNGPLAFKSLDVKLGNMEQGSSRSDAVTVANLSGKAVTVSFSGISENLSVSMDKARIEAGGTAKLTYTVNADRRLWGKNYYYATIVADGRPLEKRFAVWAFTKENFTALSRQEMERAARPMFKESSANVGILPQGKITRISFPFENQGKDKLIIFKIDSDSPAILPSEAPQVEAGGKGSIELVLDSSVLAKGEFLAVVTLTTNSPLRPLVNLFVAGAVK